VYEYKYVYMSVRVCVWEFVSVVSVLSMHVRMSVWESEVICEVSG